MFKRFPGLNAKVHKRCIVARDFGAIRRRRLLAEFLRTRRHGDQETWSQVPDHQVEINVDDHELMITLSDDLLFKILLLLPSESLFRSQFVCKKWFSLINTSLFITCHNKQYYEPVLICRKLTLSLPKSYFHFLDLNNGGNIFLESSTVGLVDILASYDGLILATIGNNRESLMLMNPITRKHVLLPEFGIECDSCVVETLGIAFCNKAKTYKIVHAYGERSGLTSCGIFSIGGRKWTRIEGPPFELLRDMTRMPVTIGGSLYWLSKTPRRDYLVVMDLNCEKFVAKNLPISTTVHDRLIEIKGKIGFVTHDSGLDQLQVWILIMESGSRVKWMKKYTINTSVYYMTPKPICCSKRGEEIVLEMMNELYVFNFERGEMKLIQSTSGDEVGFERAFDEYIPHRNTLASWEDHLEVL